ncbi:MAG: hypothetical protein FJX73_07300 [Armatimonadetes bacterium]|nr:hypothetical protein [Armatimonadota bacterium]
MLAAVRLGCPLALVVILAAAAVPARAADPIQRVEIGLVVDGGDPHPLVARRIVEAITTASERLLLGRDSEVVARQEAALAGVLREVIDRVVRGYRTVGLGFQTGATTVVRIQLQPRLPVLGEVPVVTSLPGVHPDAQPLVRASLEPVVLELRGLVARLPAEALEWAAPIIERRITELVEGASPGFTGTARIESDPPWRVAVSVTARDTRVIRDIGVRFRSSSIPFVLLESHAPQVASMAEPLRGLPVAFAQAQRARLESLVGEQLRTYPPVRQYGVVASPTLRIAEVTYLSVVADSTLYRGRVEARLNFGTSAPAPDVRIQLGRLFGSVEPFVEMTLVPSNLAWRWAAGLRVQAGTDLAMGVLTRFESEGLEPFVQYRLSPDMHIHGTFMPRSDRVEMTLTYRINEFLSWEAVATSRGAVWLRLASNL